MPRLLAVADSDSYLKWLALTFPRDAGWEARLAVLEGSAAPSASQVEAALDGSAWAPEHVERISIPALAGLAKEHDVLALGARGATFLAVGRAVVGLGAARPVVVTGVPGMALPARRKALAYRSFVDLWIVHSVRERDAYQAAAAGTPLAGRFRLGTLPRAATAAVRPDPAGPVVFATQAMVPPRRGDRLRLAQMLVDLARAQAPREVVIKVRNLGDEVQTHRDSFPLPALVDEVTGGEWPENLVVRSGPMHQHLDGAAALVTVSSTAALEALGFDVPVAFLTDLGTGEQLLNEAFDGSGLQRSLAEIAAGGWGLGDPDWRRDNYFHDPAADDWRGELDRLVEARTRGELPAARLLAEAELSAYARAYWRATAVAPADRTRVDAAVVAIEGLRRRLLGRLVRPVLRRARGVVRRLAGGAR